MAKALGGIATAASCSNIAFVKYWGNRDNSLRIPANGSISMNLGGLETVTTVNFTRELSADTLVLNGQPQDDHATARVTHHLNMIRRMVGTRIKAQVITENNFPTGTGIASSASGFAALSMAACAALGLDLTERQMSTISRMGSGSASRSVPAGFVEWIPGKSHETSYATSIAPAHHWALTDLIAIVSDQHKPVGSTEGHGLAPTSPLQAARVKDTQRRLSICREAILSRDFATLAEIIEHDTLMMHAVMMTSDPALIYWLPATLAVMEQVRLWRADGLGAAFTIDAGPNVHVICEAEQAGEVKARLKKIRGVSRVLGASPGGPTRLLDTHLST